jgi:hypothetical protein
MAQTPQHTPEDPEPTEFRVRIVSIDYYLAPPVPLVDLCYSSLEGTAIDKVPVVRIFGSTPAGQKVCLHLHKVSDCITCVCVGKKCCNTLQPELDCAMCHWMYLRCSPQAFPYFYVPYDDDLPTESAAGRA